MKKIALIYTGGTIGMVRDNASASLVPFDFQGIKNKIPEIELLAIDIAYFSLNPVIDSSDMDGAVWKKIAQLIEELYNQYFGFVVLHGTDTMAYSASAISYMTQGLKKPIIFTGSQLPIGDLRTDAKENLITSLHYATLENNGQAAIQEVCLYFEYKLFRANRTTKVSTGHFNAFRSPNMPELGESGVDLSIRHDLLFRDKAVSFSINDNISNDVLLLKIFPSMNIKQYMPMIFNNESVIILEAYGSGNVPLNPAWKDFLYQIKDAKRKIIVITQCYMGKVNFGKYQNSSIFLEIGAIDGKDLTTEAAVCKAMFGINYYPTIGDFKQFMEQNYRGELTV